MYSILLVSLMSMPGQEAGSSSGYPDRPLADQLAAHGINIWNRHYPNGAILPEASIDLRKAGSLIGLNLLREVKLLALAHVVAEDAERTDQLIKIIATFPKLKVLSLKTKTLTAKELPRLAGLRSLEKLTLECPDLTDAHARRLEALKELPQLKSVRLQYAHISPESLARLQKSLPQVTTFDFDEDISVRLLKMAAVTARDDQLTKLKKQKLTAALRQLQVHYYDAKVNYRYLDTLAECGKKVTDAAMDLSDQDLKRIIIGEYIRFLESIYLLGERRFKCKRDDGSMSHLFPPMLEYYYLDAQILQRRLKKQSEERKGPGKQQDS
jgi:hypothetical protein